MSIKNPIRYSTKLKDDVAFITRKLRKLSYLIPDADIALIDTLTELENYTKDICEALISKANREVNTNDTSRI